MAEASASGLLNPDTQARGQLPSQAMTVRGGAGGVGGTGLDRAPRTIKCPETVQSVKGRSPNVIVACETLPEAVQCI